MECIAPKNSDQREKIDTISRSSLNNKHVFIEIDPFLKADHIIHIRFIRKYNKANITNYTGTLDKSEINLLLKEIPITEFPYFLMLKNIFPNYYSIEINQSHKSFNDSFIFDIEEEYLNSLSKANKFILFQRLQDIVNLLYLKLMPDVDIEFKTKTSYSTNGDLKAHLLQLCKQFDITKQELVYLNAISLIGSSKEIGRAINKSPRTIEKAIQGLLIKLKLRNKSQLQVMAKIITSHSNQTITQEVLERVDQYC